MPQIYVPMTALPAPPGAHQSPGTGAFIARAAPTGLQIPWQQLQHGAVTGEMVSLL